MNCLSLDRFPPLVEGPMEKELAQSEKAFDDVTEELESVSAVNNGWIDWWSSHWYLGNSVITDLTLSKQGYYSGQASFPNLKTIRFDGAFTAVPAFSQVSVPKLRSIYLGSQITSIASDAFTGFSTTGAWTFTDKCTIYCDFSSSTSPLMQNSTWTSYHWGTGFTPSWSPDNAVKFVFLDGVLE